MPQCPQCSKPLMSLARQCPSCRADLDLLVDYVNGLQTNLVRAEQLTRAGELAQAMWAYLEVLEVDPDNAAARQQVSQIATAVRQFDRTAPGRRWLEGQGGADGGGFWLWLKALLMAVALLFAFSTGFMVARNMDAPSAPPASEEKKEKDKTKPPMNDNKRDLQLGR